MLGDREPMPIGVGFDHALMSVFFEVAQEMMLEGGIVASETLEGGEEVIVGVGEPTKDILRAVTSDDFVIGIGKDGILQFVPSGDGNFVHELLLFVLI